MFLVVIGRELVISVLISCLENKAQINGILPLKWSEYIL